MGSVEVGVVGIHDGGVGEDDAVLGEDAEVQYLHIAKVQIYSEKCLA